MEYKLPLIIKEALGGGIYNQMSNIIKVNDYEREYIIYGSPEAIKTIEDAITEEIKLLINK